MIIPIKLCYFKIGLSISTTLLHLFTKIWILLMLLKRDLEITLKRYTKFRVIAILGPRQSGKTTLVKKFFKNHIFLSLEDINLREFARTDPRGFINQHDNKNGIIIDEFQYAPDILSYVQLEADEKNRSGYFILTGSQNFLMNQAITQSLAGRVGILTLLPFSNYELKEHNLLKKNPLEHIIQGSYPRLYKEEIPFYDLYPSYIRTYIERDVRQLTNIGDLAVFQKFLSLCAGRIGQLLNLSEIAMHCGISAPTANKWLTILEASYILFRLQPHFNNFNKRITKRSKLYFYDTGIASYLLKISSIQALITNPFRGSLFENFIIADLYKQFFNRGHRPPLYFWRDRNGTIEIDCIIDRGENKIPIEIKSGETIVPTFFKTITKWNEISGTKSENNYIIYAGQTEQKRSKGYVKK